MEIDRIADAIDHVKSGENPVEIIWSSHPNWPQPVSTELVRPLQFSESLDPVNQNHPRLRGIVHQNPNRVHFGSLS